MSNLLSIGKTGLMAAQTGIATTGHNITNATVPGYSRQGIVQSTTPPIQQGVGYIGTGTEVAQIKRYYDNFLNTQLLNAQANQGSVDAYLGQISQIDNMLSDSTIGLSPALQDFFKGVQTANSTPSLQAARESMLSSSQTLTGRFHEVSGRLTELQNGVNSSISSTVNTINAYSTQIADLNTKIAAATADPLNPPNDLLDQRDQLIRELNQQVKVTVLPGDNNMLNVSIGSGQPLVVGVSSMELASTTSPTDPNRTVVAYQTPGRQSVLPDDTFSGGALGGLIAFRNETLDRVQNQVGQIAAGLADAFNDQHRLGQDLNGELGGDFFAPIKAYVGYDTRNSPLSTAKVEGIVTDASKLTTADYNVTFDGTNYNFERADGVAVTPSSVAPNTPTEIDGVTYNFTGDGQDGDRFQVRPTYQAAADITVAITDYKKIALAAPVSTSVPSSNKGNGTISAGVVDPSYVDTPLTAPVTIAFHQTDPADKNTRTIDGFPAGTTVTIKQPNGTENTYVDGDTIPYTEGATISFNGVSFVLAGAPKDGDTFTIGPNTSGVGDSRNGVLLAGLQTKNILNGGSATFQGGYASTVNYVGNKTREMQVGSASATTAVNQARASQQSVSGVNLDEEAADLLRYQQAYQAAGKVMQIAGQLFDTLLQIGN